MRRLSTVLFTVLALVVASVLGYTAVQGFTGAGLDAESASGSSSGGSPGGTNPPLERGEVMVRMEGIAYPDGNRTIVAGTEVTWTNLDDAPHTVTARNDDFLSPDLPKGGTYSHEYLDLGSFEYYCVIHPFMTGTITVLPAPYGG